jgi:calcineurin-like phosphoesterase family protein
MNRYIADLHFGHSNIIKFDNRPFDSVDDMNETLIRNWNKVVGKGDTTYILGDFCWGKEPEWIELLNKLNGNKVLIRGNHDIKQMSKTLKDKFVCVKDRYELNDCGKKLILSHYPELAYKSDYNENVFMLHGHVHYLTNEAVLIRKWVKELQNCRKFDWDNRGQIINVGCMLKEMDYTPRTLMEILQANGYFLNEE